VTSLDFDDQGDFLIGAGNDDSMHVYDVKEGKYNKSVASKKYGVHLARFTHHSRQVLHASTKIDSMCSETLALDSLAHRSQIICGYWTSTTRVTFDISLAIMTK
jgi:hypothetical protein